MGNILAFKTGTTTVQESLVTVMRLQLSGALPIRRTTNAVCTLSPLAYPVWHPT